MARQHAGTAEDAHRRADPAQALGRFSEFCDNPEHAPRFSSGPGLFDQLGRQRPWNFVCRIHVRLDALNALCG
jgi:hypothetical protein